MKQKSIDIKQEFAYIVPEVGNDLGPYQTEDYRY